MRQVGSTNLLCSLCYNMLRDYRFPSADGAGLLLGRLGRSAISLQPGFASKGRAHAFGGCWDACSKMSDALDSLYQEGRRHGPPVELPSKLQALHFR